MARLLLLLAICLAILLPACGPAVPAHTPNVATIPVAGTAFASTASVGTVLPVLITPLPPDSHSAGWPAGRARSYRA
jgi:hypothetical protein